MKRITVLLCYISLGTYSSTWRQPQQPPRYSGLSQHLWQENNRSQEGFIRAQCWPNSSPLNANASSIKDQIDWLWVSLTEILLTWGNWMYTNREVTDQTCGDKENQSELCCLLDPPPSQTQLPQDDRKEGLRGEKKPTSKVVSNPTCFWTKGVSLNTGLKDIMYRFHLDPNLNNDNRQNFKTDSWKLNGKQRLRGKAKLVCQLNQK